MREIVSRLASHVASSSKSGTPGQEARNYAKTVLAAVRPDEAEGYLKAFEALVTGLPPQRRERAARALLHLTGHAGNPAFLPFTHNAPRLARQVKRHARKIRGDLLLKQWSDNAFINAARRQALSSQEFRELRKCLAASNWFKSAAPDQRKSLVDEQERLFFVVWQARALNAEGVSFNRLEEKLRIPNTTLKEWIEKKHLPKLISVKHFKRADSTPLLSTTFDRGMAELAGFYLVRLKPFEHSGLQMTTRDKSLISRVAKRIREKTGKTPGVYPVRDGWKLQVSSRELLSHLQKITKNGTYPAIHLLDSGTRKSMLQAILHARGSTYFTPSSRGLDIEKHGARGLFEQLLPLFAEYEAYGRITKNGSRLTFSDAGDLWRLKRNALLPKQKALQIKKPLTSPLTVAQYEKAQKMLDRGTKLSEVAEKVGVDPKTIHNWVKKTTPEFVQRYANICRLAEKHCIPFKVRYPRAVEEGLDQLKLGEPQTTVLQTVGTAMQGKGNTPEATVIPHFDESIQASETRGHLFSEIRSLTTLEQHAVKQLLRGRVLNTKHYRSAMAKLRESPRLKLARKTSR